MNCFYISVYVLYHTNCGNYSVFGVFFLSAPANVVVYYMLITIDLLCFRIDDAILSVLYLITSFTESLTGSLVFFIKHFSYCLQSLPYSDNSVFASHLLSNLDLVNGQSFSLGLVLIAQALPYYCFVMISYGIVSYVCSCLIHSLCTFSFGGFLTLSSATFPIGHVIFCQC